MPYGTTKDILGNNHNLKLFLFHNFDYETLFLTYTLSKQKHIFLCRVIWNLFNMALIVVVLHRHNIFMIWALIYLPSYSVLHLPHLQMGVMIHSRRKPHNQALEVMTKMSLMVQIMWFHFLKWDMLPAQGPFCAHFSSIRKYFH